MTRRPYLYFILIFIFGVVIGWAGTYMYGWYSGHWHHRRSHHHVVEYLRSQLNLSDSQTHDLRQIVDDMEKKDSELHEQLEPQFHAIREEARDRVRLILNPQQLAKFNEMVKQWDARMNRRSHPHQQTSGRSSEQPRPQHQ